MIGGNTCAALQKMADKPNGMGVSVSTWTDLIKIRGWIDMRGGGAHYMQNAKIQETTHLFLCDYIEVPPHKDAIRLVCAGRAYDVLLIDDPMGMHRQLEIYLKYTGVPI